MKKFNLLAIMFAFATVISCKDSSKSGDPNVKEDKYQETDAQTNSQTNPETNASVDHSGQNIGNNTDSTSIDEPSANPSNN